jgi:glutamine amidotransferase
LIVIVDYGMGNLRSVEKAFEFLGCRVKVSSNPKEIESASALVLPGVGAFKDCRENLEKKSLVEPILSFLEKERPYLGICLGMQMLFSYSEEGGVKGFSLFKGAVKRLPPKNKVPHMGWNNVFYENDSLLFKGISEGSFFYFVHSYYAEPEEKVRVGYTDYGVKITAAVERGNIFGVQFHPEKSGRLGLKVLENFRSLV